jgi:hypothetical protein
MSLKYTSLPSKILAESITAAATSFKLNNINGWDGEPLVTGDFGSTAYGVFRNATKTAIELFEWDPSTIAAGSITITRRGLQFDGNLTTEVSANKLSWTKGDTIVDLGTDTPQMLQELRDYIDNAVVAGGVPATASVLGLVKMSTAPADPANPIAVSTNDSRLPTQDENDAMAGDAAPSSVNRFLVKGKLLIAGETINGATLPVPVYQDKVDNEFYSCDANDTSKINFIGFAISNAVNGGNINIQFSGIVSGFTGLQEGEKYYVQDTAGVIGTSPGTNEIIVGVAISETELLIQKSKRYAAGNGNAIGIATGSQSVTLGFRPSVIRLIARAFGSGATPAMSFLDMTNVNGSSFGISSASNPGGTPTIENTTRLYAPASFANYMTFTIGSITDTGFTINWTETGSYSSSDDGFYWEAQGEL